VHALLNGKENSRNGERETMYKHENMTQNVDEEMKSKNCNLLKWVGYYDLPVCRW